MTGCLTELNNKTLTSLPLLLLLLLLFCLFYGFHGASSFSRPTTPLNTASKSISIYPEALWNRYSLPQVSCFVCVCLCYSHHPTNWLGLFPAFVPSQVGRPSMRQRCSISHKFSALAKEILVHLRCCD